ncbi:hypothetical protein RB614_31615 [Phytohabitans sp. ZYX-F-186]|uniref:Uncharacterized protein n=1 Tax=Phytohabitans maris TaxID=3071409 RepID=A0ABU0ZS55_9ACTN|nr:hypothetical protein [Phytohabitans sp. ZYX-F-186]MDQ7909080.1 hypothetical protein [Phytohabitans sp. ZYX-F-186]
MNLQNRLGFAAYLRDAYDDVGHAVKQVNRTAGMISREDKIFPERFSRNIRGIIVVAEPHYMINSKQYRQLTLDDPLSQTMTTLRLPEADYPTTVVSLEELEEIVELVFKTGTFELLDVLTTPGQNGTEVGAILARYRAQNVI